MYRRPDWKPASKEEIAEWVDRYRASSLGLRQFAEENALPVERLRYWIYGRGPRKRPKAQTAVAPVFQEIKLAAGFALESWAVEIKLPSGLAVRFNAAANPAWIGLIVQALQRPC